MKILRETPDQLILENNPVLLAIMLGGLALVFIGAGLFTMSEDLWKGVATTAGGIVLGAALIGAFIRRSQVIFDRPGNSVELRRRSVLGYSRRTWDLSDLDRAIVQSSRSSKGSTTYRAALVFSGGMDAGIHPLTLVYSSGYGADRAKDAVNRWLENARET